ncbi:hypothetical protein [Pseudoxanthomonas sp.]|uniref:putative quinol monooxygenase n=1 Tax=Pseudoxanthomonas sp. TaxID=1871049 RepID=UPI00260847B3|nr:hypothetical protein [Pseudoxanthomonas sp.]WDS35808.1 MAG: hypothetical protein O8I58_16030 [Pseudoxanthomonas sp.]
MSTVAGVIVFKARAGLGGQAASEIEAVLPHVQAEHGTPLWLLLRSSVEPDTLFLVDLFKGSEGRDAHMQGQAARIIFDRLPPLLAAAPEIHPSDVVAVKGY